MNENQMAKATFAVDNDYLAITTETKQEVYRFVGREAVFVKSMNLPSTFIGNVG